MDGLNEVLDLINDQNALPVNIRTDNVIISLPRALPPFSVPNQGDRNTGVQLGGIENKGYKGNTEVYYKRGDLDKLFTGLTPKLRSREFSINSVLETVNRRYGLKLEHRDLHPYDVPDFTIDELETSKFIKFRVIDNSYRWVGEVNIELRFGNPRLEPLIFVQLLPMLSHPEEVSTLGDQYSGRMATYGFDFTRWKDKLIIDDVTGKWADFATVQEVVKKSGVSYWYNGPVVDLPTIDVEDANQDFQRVMVQYVTQGMIKGPLYLHYDVTW